VTYGTDYSSTQPSERLRSKINTAPQDDKALNKTLLMAMAQEVLPLTMGDIFSQIVQTCLTCLDDENMDFGSAQALEDEDGILVGVRYIERILGRLGEIQV
jgi:hypothetical protein